MIVDIPLETPWSQKNKGDILGTIWSTRNVDFKKEVGFVSPTYKMIVTTLDGDANNPTDLAVGFCKEQGTINSISGVRWWTVAGTSIFETTSESGDFDEDDSGSLPVTDGKDSVDIKAFNGRVYVASEDTLYRRSGTAYTTVTTSLPKDKKILDVYGDRLYIASEDQVDSIDVAETLATTTYTLDINTATNENLSISAMRKVSNGLWIATYNNQGGRAKVMFWDGITQDTVEILKEVESGMVMAMSIKDDIPYILDNRGVVSYFNGSFFEEIARIDLDYKQLYRFDSFSNNDRWIHYNGMQTIDDEILFAINTRMEDTSDNQIPRTPSGIYAYNKDIGIYHKFSFTAQRDDTTVTDMGQLEVVEVGGIYSMVDDEENDAKTDQSDFFVGFGYKSDNGTTKYAIAKSDKRGLDLNSASRTTAGLITTTKWFADEVTENWEKFYAFIRPLRKSTDKLVLKCREKEFIPVETSITWVNTTSFTSTDGDWATIKTNYENSKEYEFEGLQGDGAGFLAHITDIQESGGTYTVTLDEVITGATTNTAKARIDRWRKVAEFTDVDELLSYIEFSPDFNSTWIQYRLYMIGEEIQLQRIKSKSSITKDV